jgi:hypothetical protein
VVNFTRLSRRSLFPFTQNSFSGNYLPAAFACRKTPTGATKPNKMIPLKRIPLLLAILLTFTATGFAQKFCTVPPPSPFKHNALIVTSYDQQAGRMKTTLEHPRALGDGVYLYASFFYQDRRSRSLPTIDIYFVAPSKKPKYRDSHNLSLFADNAPTSPLGAAQYYTESAAHGLTVEKIKITLTYASLLNLIKARRVTARLGATEFELTNNHLESLREIAMLMAPPTNLAKR